MAGVGGIGRIGQIGAPSTGGGFPNPPFPAPAGYRWAFVYEGSSIENEGNQRVIELVVIT